MDNGQKAYDRLIDYVEAQIMNGRYKKGDKLLPERDLAAALGLSRNSVREGICILERMGAVTSLQGAGNYVTGNFDKTLIEVMSLMFMMEGEGFREIAEFRYSLEYQSLCLAIDRADEGQISEMKRYARMLARAPKEEDRVFYDKLIHYSISEACGNRFIKMNLMALNEVMDTFIKDMRARILTDPENQQGLLDAHVQIIQAIEDRDKEAGLQALDRHFSYIYAYLDR